jgi:flagella basal body P-ring formation protein FlgA
MRHPILLAIAAILASPAQAATLRTVTTLHGPRVLLSDLFDNAGANAARVLGPGPAPGGRIVVEAPQLAAIAKQFGVDWTPSSNADRAVLDWPGRPLPREAVLDALRDALAAGGTDPKDCVIDLAGFTPPLVPFDGTPQAVVSQLELDHTTGRFTAVLSVTGDGFPPLNTRIGGRVDIMIELPVASARLPPGTVLRPEDIHLGRVRAQEANREVARTLQQAIGLQVRYQIAAGQPLPLGDLTPPALVHRGTHVLMLLDSPGITLSAQGIALESGALGERIHVLNPVSRATLEADVVGQNRVRVSPSGVPLRTAARALTDIGMP